jgi:hypothetical protein
MANLLGQNIGTNYKGILNLNTLNGNLTTTLEAITDGDGNASTLLLSTTLARVSSNLTIGGSTTASARLHVRGDGTNPIARFENNSGVSFFRVNQAANASLTVGDDSTANFGRIEIDGSGNLVLTANGGQGKGFFINNLSSALQINNAFQTGGAYVFSLANYNNSSATQQGLAISTGVSVTNAGSGSVRIFSTNYTINNSAAQTGTATGIFLNATETALNGMAHNLMDLQVGGSSRFRVANSGVSSITSNLSLGILNLTNTSCSFVFGGDSTGGYLQPLTASKGISLYNSGGTSYIEIKGDSSGILFVSAGLFQLNGTTNAFPAIKRNGAAIDFRLADDSAFCSIVANNIRTNSGSAGTVAYGTNGLTNGMYGAGGNSVGISTGGTARVYIDASNISFASALCVSTSATNTANASAILQADSTTRGFLPPRLTTAQRDLIGTPAAGLMIYNTSTNRPNFYDGSAWVAL